MATKNHADNSVAERRLRPIYDWLDCGNNKKALQEADKLLKKQSNFQCAKVLKGLALLRLGKEKQCEELISAVHAEVPYNDTTLQAMTICYRELHRPELICDMYAAATKKDPTNEELLTHLFMSYVRVGDYQKQQRTAMLLYKLAPKNPYYFWAVMSIVMQAHTSQPDLKCSVVLPLAERMVDKIVAEDKIEAEQEVQLYLMILEMQGKLEEALKVIEGPLGEKLQSCIVLPAKRVQLLMKLKRFSQANVMLKQLLREEMDCWSHYKDYLDSVFCLIDKTDSDDDEYYKDADKTILECAGFLSNIQEDNQRLNHRLRGPYLAHLEFYARLSKRGETTDVYLGDLVELFMLYFHEFGAKQCCLSDLKSYLMLMSEEQIKDFLDQVFKLVQLTEGEMPSTLQQMLRYISNLQLSRFLGFHETLNQESKLKLAMCLIEYYKHGLQFNENMLPTDFGHSDPYALLVANILYDTWIESNDVLFLKEAIVVLENALSHSVSNYQLKLLLLKFYNLLGATKAGLRVFELLDIKHMQLDTLGYFQLGPLLSTGQYMIATHIFNMTLKFFTASCRESSDHLTISYKYGSFLKISEFVEFRDRLNNSMHYAFVQVEKPFMDILHATSHDHTAQLVAQASVTPYFKMAWNKLEDNRDFVTVWSANPPNRRLTDKLIKQSYDTEIDLLRIRILLLQILMCAVNFNNEYNEENKRDVSLSNGEEKENSCVSNAVDLKNLVEELIRVYDNVVASPHVELPQGIIEGPPESRLPDYVNSSMVPIVYNLFIVINSLLHKKEGNNLNTKINLNIEDKKLTNGCQQNNCNNVGSSESSCGDNRDENRWRNCGTSDYAKASKNVSSMLLKATNSLLSKIKEITNSDNLKSRLNIIKEMTLVLEMTCWTTVMCGVVHSLVKQNVKTPLVKKGKKKRPSTNKPKESDELSEDDKSQLDAVEVLISNTLKAVELLNAAVNHLETVWMVDSISCEMSLLNITETSGLSLNERINDSYATSLSEVSSVLRRKHRHLGELKLL